MDLTTNEVVALFDVDENRVRKDVAHGILDRSHPPRFGLPEVVYMRAVGELGFELGAIDDRKQLYKRILQALKTAVLTIAVSPIMDLKLERVVREIKDKVERFTAWKDRLVVDKRILGGEPVFPRSRLAVRQVGGMLARGASPAEIREDYPYLKLEDIEFAGMFVRAYPKVGRPRDRKTPAR